MTPTNSGVQLGSVKVVTLDVPRDRAPILRGEQARALNGLRTLAERARRSGNTALAAENWWLVAPSLAK
ncbi:hypothetical protein [Streptomyces sp. NPDC048560]|uniref:hypothetical protein n=1 Tax=Streptomyces sp. NPDC048560 TaxID=3155488 RepID=UPI0034369893